LAWRPLLQGHVIVLRHASAAICTNRPLNVRHNGFSCGYRHYRPLVGELLKAAANKRPARSTAACGHKDDLTRLRHTNEELGRHVQLHEEVMRQLMVGNHTLTQRLASHAGVTDLTAHRHRPSRGTVDDYQPKRTQVWLAYCADHREDLPMTDSFVVARNPEPASTLPYLLRLPLPEGPLLLKAREPWPRTAKVYCHRAAPADWPADAEILEEIPVRSCMRRGVAIDLVLDRPRENRSQLVFARLPGQGGREAIFWQTARTSAKGRPGVRVPRRRAAGYTELEILVDTRERYPWRFIHQQTHTKRQALPAGDYAVESDGRMVAAVERKTLADLANSLVDGSLTYTLAELASLPRAAVVVEDRYSGLFKLERVNGGWVAELLAAIQVRYTTVPIVFAETRALAQEWTFRFLGAGLAYAQATDKAHR
jgi:hypothetical protein